MGFILTYIFNLFSDLLFLGGILFFVEGFIKDSPTWVFVVGMVASIIGLELIISRNITEANEKLREELSGEIEDAISDLKEEHNDFYE